jgi:hypothetical protein
VDTFKITDDFGMLAIVNAARYSGFVDRDWEADQLLEHFIAEMKKADLVVWATGLENLWTVDIGPTPSSRPAFREFTRPIEVTDGRLYLTNYEDLTMAAQFEDISLPLEHNTDLVIPLDNGTYTVTVRQMFDPDHYKPDPQDDAGFEIVIAPATPDGSAPPIEKIPWHR